MENRQSEALTALHKIQAELKAPKDQYNSFGKYKYRNAEGILEAAKPLAFRENCTLKVSDEVMHIGDRYYVKATAILTSITDGSIELAEASAREDEVKKGMDGAQITGAASSYARKYALNGLLAIDDTKDPDATNTHGKGGDDKLEKTTTNTASKPANDLGDKISASKSMEELQTLWDSNPDLQKNKQFIADVTAKKKALSLRK